MSRRTAEASKAIAVAWEKEQKLVQEGKGTRDWTPEQQKDILERGKAYDENGRAFEGQHMRSVAENPEFQGDPDNIQFLTREEHLAAHDGDWKNPSNWYYDPVTKTKIDFGDGPIIPCKVINLSQPISELANAIVEKADDILPRSSPSKEQSSGTKQIESVQRKDECGDTVQKTENKKTEHSSATKSAKQQYTVPKKKSIWQRAWNGIRSTVGVAVQTAKENPVETILTLIGIAKGINDISKAVRSNKRTSDIESSDYIQSNVDKPTIVSQRPFPLEEITDIVDGATHSGLLTGLNNQSFLARAGYSMYDNEESRHAILCQVADSEGSERIIDLLQFLIKTRMNQQNGADKYKRAIEIWQSDIEYLKKH